MIDCEPKPLNEEILVPIKNKECCVAYVIDWAHHPITDIFCSSYVDIPYCMIDIKILQSTISKHCYMSSLMQMMKLTKSRRKLKELCIITLIKRYQAPSKKNIS